MFVSTKLLLPTIIVTLVATALFAVRSGKIQPVYANNSTSFNYTVLGDSTSISTATPYPITYKNYIGSDLGGVPVAVTNLAVFGWGSAQLLGHLQTDQTVIDSVKNAHLVTVMIGINDYAIYRNWYLTGVGPFPGPCGGSDNQDCLRSGEDQFVNHYTAIIARIKSLNPKAVIIAGDFYNATITQDIASGDDTVLKPFFDNLINTIHTVSAANGISVANVYQAFNGAGGLEDPVAKGYLDSDNFHPNEQGNLVIADKFKKDNYAILAADSDSDGFTNKAEKYYGTNLLDSCPAGTTDSAWAPDFNNDGRVTVADILAVVQKYNTTLARYDLNQDGKVTTADINLESTYYNKLCTP